MLLAHLHSMLHSHALHRLWFCCRHSGPLKADLLQQFVADRLLELPPAPAVDPETIDRFLAHVPHHKVAVLAFSTATKASIPLRHAAEQHKHHVVAGRVQWTAEVLGSCLLGVFKRALQAPVVLYRIIC